MCTLLKFSAAVMKSIISTCVEIKALIERNHYCMDINVKDCINCETIALHAFKDCQKLSLAEMRDKEGVPRRLTFNSRSFCNI